MNSKNSGSGRSIRKVLKSSTSPSLFAFNRLKPTSPRFGSILLCEKPYSSCESRPLRRFKIYEVAYRLCLGCGQVTRFGLFLPTPYAGEMLEIVEIVSIMLRSVVADGKSEWLFNDSDRLNLQPSGQAPPPQSAQGANSTDND